MVYIMILIMLVVWVIVMIAIYINWKYSIKNQEKNLKNLKEKYGEDVFDIFEPQDTRRKGYSKNYSNGKI